MPQSGGARVAGLGGVGGAARVHGAERNTRGPSAQPGSGQRGSYKPPAKTSAAQRESEGTIVVRRPATNNAGGTKGPCGGNVGRAGTRKGMTGKTGSNHPDGRESIDHVRQLQRRLWSAAKRQPGRRFHALLDRIYRRDVLWEAWRRVKQNRGAAGVDAMTLTVVEQLGVEGFLDDLGARLQAGTYRPSAVRRRYIPKADGRQRPLGIPTVRDRVAQMAATLVLEPIFEADFQPCSYGFRPYRRAHDAVAEVRHFTSNPRNYEWVVEGDITACFDEISHPALMERVRKRISDKRVLALVKAFLKAGVLSRDTGLRETHAGTPQGGILTPPTQLAIRSRFALRVGVGAVSGRAGWAVTDRDGVADGDLVGSDEDILDEEPQDSLAFGDRRGSGLVTEAGEEVLEVVGDQRLEERPAVVRGVDMSSSDPTRSPSPLHPGPSRPNQRDRKQPRHRLGGRHAT